MKVPCQRPFCADFAARQFFENLARLLAARIFFARNIKAILVMFRRIDAPQPHFSAVYYEAVIISKMIDDTGKLILSLSVMRGKRQGEDNQAANRE